MVRKNRAHFNYPLNASHVRVEKTRAIMEVASVEKFSKLNFYINPANDDWLMLETNCHSHRSRVPQINRRGKKISDANAIGCKNSMLRQIIALFGRALHLSSVFSLTAVHVFHWTWSATAGQNVSR